MLYELEGIPEELAREAFRLAGDKLPVKSTFVRRTIM
jgi:large subunit ribosomal protein L16